MLHPLTLPNQQKSEYFRQTYFKSSTVNIIIFSKFSSLQENLSGEASFYSNYLFHICVTMEKRASK